MTERVQKIMSECGICSRRAAEKLISNGKVLVNGKTASLGDKADMENDVIEVNGKVISGSAKVYVMLNKPRGFITTLDDERGRRMVSDLVDVGTRIYPVGRLDYNSEGMLIMTNDGELTYRLTHPSHDVPKSYIVTVRGKLETGLTVLKSPIEIDGRETLPADVSVLSENSAGGLLLITIREGRNRQIRRMCEAADLRVLRLKRVTIGELELDRLPAGKWRYLTENEIKYLKSL